MSVLLGPQPVRPMQATIKIANRFTAFLPGGLPASPDDGPANSRQLGSKPLPARPSHQILGERPPQVLVRPQLDVVDVMQPATGLKLLAELVQLRQIPLAHPDRV